jgi:hypothetical protein
MASLQGEGGPPLGGLPGGTPSKQIAILYWEGIIPLLTHPGGMGGKNNQHKLNPLGRWVARNTGNPP